MSRFLSPLRIVASLIVFSLLVLATPARGADHGPSPSFVENAWQVSDAVDDGRTTVVNHSTLLDSPAGPRTGTASLSPERHLKATWGKPLASGRTLARAALARSVQRTSGLAPDSTAPQSRKDPTNAFWLSLGSTLAPVGAGLIVGSISEDAVGAGFLIGFLGTFFGPSVGHFYADNSQALWGLGIRGVSAAGFTVAVDLILDDLFEEQSEAESFGQGVLLFGSLGVYAGSMIYDVATAPDSAEEYNEEHGLSARVAPAYDAPSDGVGLAVQVEF